MAVFRRGRVFATGGGHIPRNIRATLKLIELAAPALQLSVLRRARIFVPLQIEVPVTQGTWMEVLPFP